MLLPFLHASAVMLASIGQTDLTATQCQALLKGTWEAHIEARLSIVMEIDGDNIKLFTVADNQKSQSWTGKLLVSKTVPMQHFDWKERMSANGPLPDNQCLYHYLGDTLLVIGGGPDRRPDEFLSGHGNEPKTLVFTRVSTTGKSNSHGGR